MEEYEKTESIQELFLRLTHLYYRNLFPELKNTGVHPKQLPVIELLREHEGISQRKICEYMEIRPSTVANTVGCLEKSGIVKKKTDPEDSRKTNVFLTEKGKQIAEDSKKYIEEREGKLLNGFYETERLLLKKLLRQMIRNIQDETGKNKQ